MKILLPPSETKRPGGDGDPLSLDTFVLPSLTSARECVVEALVTLASDPETAQRVLKLSDRQRGEIENNARLRVARTMAAVDRYTGVLFDALEAQSLDAAARGWLGEHVWIHSAPFGPIAALDAIPAYRLAAGASLPGLGGLKRFWMDATTAAIADSEPGFVLDLRSEAYVALGPVPESVAGAYVRVVTETGKALNHFNKRSKGLLVRALARHSVLAETAEELRVRSAALGFELRETSDARVLELVIAGRTSETCR